MKHYDWDNILQYMDDELLEEALAPAAGKKTKARQGKRVYRTLLIAAIIASFMVTAAYAAGLLDFRALLLDKTVEIDGQEFSRISLTQPQAVPEETETAGAQENALKDADQLEEKLAASKAAWAEWEEYRCNWEGLPETFSFLRDKDGLSWVGFIENEDGSITVEIASESGKEYMTVSAEEYERLEAWEEQRSGTAYGDYDFNYQVYSQEDAAQLEEIAAKYGLKLRKGMQLMWSSETTGMRGDKFLTNQQLAEKTAEIGCAGNIFYDTPVGFDKVYWFDEGTFCVSYYVDLPSSGERVTCYGYNSMYSTLSSGGEVINREQDLDSFTQRSHTAPDGTELSILSNGRDAYIYVYLENSFFAMHIRSENGMTEEDVDYIADTLNYSLIGQG